MFTTALNNIPLVSRAITSLQSRTEPTPRPGTREAYPMDVYPNGWMASYVRAFLKDGNRSHLDKLIKNAKIDFNKPLIIDCFDLSSSIGHGAIPKYIVENQGKQLQQIGAAVGDARKSASLFQFGFCDSLKFLHPQNDGPVDLGDLKVFNPGELKNVEHGGLLEAGSRISDAAFFTAELGLALQRAGFRKPIGAAIITDGWNRNADPKLEGKNTATFEDRNYETKHGQWARFSEEAAYNSIAEGRGHAYPIKFKLLGFVNPPAVSLFDAFVANIGLNPSEVAKVICTSNFGASAASAVNTVFEKHTAFLANCSQLK